MSGAAAVPVSSGRGIWSVASPAGPVAVLVVALSRRFVGAQLYGLVVDPLRHMVPKGHANQRAGQNGLQHD